MVAFKTGSVMSEKAIVVLKSVGDTDKSDFVGVDVFSMFWFNGGNWSKSSREIGLSCISGKLTRGTKCHGFQNEPMKDTDMVDHIIEI